MFVKLLEPLLMRKVKRVAKNYHNGEFNRVLRIYDKHVACSEPSDLFRNILRICSLMRMKNDIWKSEYKACVIYGDFDNFLSVSDKKYIQLYIYSQTNEGLSSPMAYADFNLNDVSKRMKDIFPYNDEQNSLVNKLWQKSADKKPEYIKAPEASKEIDLFSEELPKSNF